MKIDKDTNIHNGFKEIKMAKIEAGCNICRRITRVKDIYIDTIGFVEMNLECGHKLVLEVKRLRQEGEK